jgi:hypothetical protein
MFHSQSGEYSLASCSFWKPPRETLTELGRGRRDDDKRHFSQTFEPGPSPRRFDRDFADENFPTAEVFGKVCHNSR